MKNEKKRGAECRATRAERGQKSAASTAAQKGIFFLSTKTLYLINNGRHINREEKRAQNNNNNNNIKKKRKE